MKRKIAVVLFLCSVIGSTAFAQLGIGVNAGYSRALNEVISESNKNNIIVGLKLTYFSTSIFQPMLDVDYTMIALDRSWIANNSYEGIFNMRYNVFKFGLSSLIKIKQNDVVQSGLVTGIGVAVWQDGRMLFDGEYYGEHTKRTPPMLTNYVGKELKPFVSLSYLGQKKIQDQLYVQIQLGAYYYLKNEAIQATYEYYDDVQNSYLLDVNDKVKSLRPFFKVSAIWKLGRDNKLIE